MRSVGAMCSGQRGPPDHLHRGAEAGRRHTGEPALGPARLAEDPPGCDRNGVPAGPRIIPVGHLHESRKVIAGREVAGGRYLERELRNTQLIHTVRKAFHVLAPVEVRIGQDAVGPVPREFIGVGDVIGMLPCSRNKLPGQQKHRNPLSRPAQTLPEMDRHDAAAHGKPEIHRQNVADPDVDAAERRDNRDGNRERQRNRNPTGDQNQACSRQHQ